MYVDSSYKAVLGAWLHKHKECLPTTSSPMVLVEKACQLLFEEFAAMLSACEVEEVVVFMYGHKAKYDAPQLLEFLSAV